MMLAPVVRSITEPDLLPEVRMILAWYPALADHPKCLASQLGAEEHDVRAILEALTIEEVLCP